MKTLLRTAALVLPLSLLAGAAFAQEEKKVPLKPVPVHAVKAAAERGWLDEARIVRENLLAMARAVLSISLCGET